MENTRIARFTVRMDAELYEMILEESRRQGLTRSQLVEQMILERIGMTNRVPEEANKCSDFMVRARKDIKNADDV